MADTSVCLLVFIVFCRVSCDNILVVSDMMSPSHKLWNYALAEGLVQKGYNVTMLAAGHMQHLGRQYENYHDIYIEGMVEILMSWEINLEDLAASSVLTNILEFHVYSITSCDLALKSEGLQTLLNYPDNFKFQAILFYLTNSPCLLPLMKRFHYPPSIAITAFLLPHYLSQQFGNDIHPAYLRSYLVDYTSDMHFGQRLLHYIWINLDLFLRHFSLKARVQDLMQKKFGDDMESIAQLEDRVSLLLCNLDHAFHNPQPLPPNIIPVEGLHIRDAGKLPKDLQDILDDAKDGAIMFALGTNVRSEALGPKRIRFILEAFSKLRQTVLWKFESNLTDLHVPENVIIRKWLPQSEILAHPNMKLFISHAGGLSTLEAAYYSVPILGMPFFVDQHHNMRLMEEKNLGRALKWESLSSAYILENILIMLNESRYSIAAKQASELMRDQKESPLQRAIYWIEYAIRHNGTHFLNLKSRNLSLFVSTSTDVKMFLSIISFGILICSVLAVIRNKLIKRGDKAKIE